MRTKFGQEEPVNNFYYMKLKSSRRLAVKRENIKNMFHFLIFFFNEILLFT